MTPEAVSARLRRVAELTDLHRDRRLATKIDLSPEGVSRRLRAVGRLTALCVRLGRRPETGGAAAAPNAAATRLAELLAAAEPEAAAAADLAYTIVGALREHPSLLRRLELHYSHILAEQLRARGEAATPQVLAARQGLSGKAPPARVDDAVLRGWLLDARDWRDGLLPVAELGAGWPIDREADT